MRTNRTVVVGLLALAAAGLLAGCGGDEPEQPETLPPPVEGGAASQEEPLVAPGTEPAMPPLQSSRATEAELPAGHPPIEGGGGMPEATGMPPGHPPIGDAGSLAGSRAPGGGAGLTWTAPAAWVEEPPSNPMRMKQYRIRGPKGEAELVVNYFGKGQGGDLMSNAKRWAGQFKQPGGGSAQEALSTSTIQVGGMRVLVVETTGTYVPMAMGGEAPGEKPNHMLLGAIAEGPDANWFFKMTGPIETVRAQRDAFLGMLKSLRRA